MANASDWSTLESATAIANNPIGQDFSEVGSPTYAAGKHGNGLQGTASAGLRCDAATFWTDNGKGAVEWWWTPASLAGGAGIQIMLFGGNGNPQLNLGQINGTTWRWLFNIESGATYMNATESVGGFATDGVPVHIAFSWDKAGIQGEGGNTVIAFVNGAQRQTSSTTWVPATWTDTNEDIIGIDAGTTAPVNGVMDNIKFYPTAVTNWDHMEDRRGGLGDTITTF